MSAPHGIFIRTDLSLNELAEELRAILQVEFGLPNGNFACLLAWDARAASIQVVSEFIEPLLRAGASYFVCWGPDCERVHDVIDEMVSKLGNELGVPDNSCIMTSWHAAEALHEALFFFLVNSWPDDHFFDTTRAGLAISIGSSAWASEIVHALDQPRSFVNRVSETT